MIRAADLEAITDIQRLVNAYETGKMPGLVIAATELKASLGAQLLSQDPQVVADATIVSATIWPVLKILDL